jgi:hypothetical protein
LRNEIPQERDPKDDQKNRWGDEVLNYLKKLKVKNWTHLVKNRETWYELQQKPKIHGGLLCQQQQKKKKNAAV